ncbi:MAG: uL30 family ribosomal protein [Candidatus Marsarchaeota archaeon]|nr:uL30 family ribosomal protein [Candidatus Marsarchaeota archaeon]
MAEKSKLLAVIRVRGRVKVRQSIAETLDRLNLRRVNNLVLVNSTNSSYMGMLKKCKDFVTFGEIDKETLAKLLTAKGIKVEDSAATSLVSGGASPKELKIELPLRMHPPKHGYEGIKSSYANGGSLGYRSEEINKLITRML